MKYLKIYEMNFEEDWEEEEPLKDFTFTRKTKSIRDKLFLDLMYSGGDSDTSHPVRIPLNIKFSEYKKHLGKIHEIINLYKELKKLDINRLFYDVKTRSYCIKRYGKESIIIDDKLQKLIDQIPNDPTTDYQNKCYLDWIKLVGFDENGDSHESYIR